MRRSILRKQHEQALAARDDKHKQVLADLQAQLDAARADAARLRAERNQFERDRDAARRETKAANARLTAELTAQTTDPDADRRAIQQWERALAAHQNWKPRADGERPVEGGTGRSMHPAVALRLSLALNRTLARQLAVAEGRPLTEVEL